jgi:hypothetical protein
MASAGVLTHLASSGKGLDLKVDAPIDYMPVFQRGGTIIPRQLRLRRSASLMETDPYTIVVALDYGDASKGTPGTAEGSLYVDDTKTFAYQQGAFALRSLRFAQGVLSCSQGVPGLLSARGGYVDVSGFKAEHTTNGSASGYSNEGGYVERVSLLGWPRPAGAGGGQQPPAKVLLHSQGGGASELSFYYDAEAARLDVRLPISSSKPRARVFDDWRIEVVEQ